MERHNKKKKKFQMTDLADHGAVTTTLSRRQDMDEHSDDHLFRQNSFLIRQSTVRTIDHCRRTCTGAQRVGRSDRSRRQEGAVNLSATPVDSPLGDALSGTCGGQDNHRILPSDVILIMKPQYEMTRVSVSMAVHGVDGPNESFQHRTKGIHRLAFFLNFGRAGAEIHEAFSGPVNVILPRDPT